MRFKGKSIADVLEMSVEEALEFFAKIPKLRRRLQTLHDVGLGYIQLGQPATTLSGGEAQRVKLAAELSKVATGRTLYILDEPTTGLHFADIEKLLEVLQRLVDAGNTVLVIEHNLDVIKQADWIVDLGPEGGEAGGEVIAVGTPEEVAEVESSHTGQFLRTVLAAPAAARLTRASRRPAPGVAARAGPEMLARWERGGDRRAARRRARAVGRIRRLRRAELAWGGFHAAEWASLVALSVVAFEADGARRRRARAVRPHDPQRARRSVRRRRRRSLPPGADPGRRPPRPGARVSRGRGGAGDRRRRRRRLRAGRARRRAARGAPAEPPRARAAARANTAGARSLECRGTDVRVARRSARARRCGAADGGWGPAAVFAACSVSSFLSFVAISGVRPPPVAWRRRGAGGVLPELREGARLSRGTDPCASWSACSVRRRSSAARSACCSWSSRSTCSGWESPASAS